MLLSFKDLQTSGFRVSEANVISTGPHSHPERQQSQSQVSQDNICLHLSSNPERHFLSAHDLMMVSFSFTWMKLTVSFVQGPESQSYFTSHTNNLHLRKIKQILLSFKERETEFQRNKVIRLGSERQLWTQPKRSLMPAQMAFHNPKLLFL